MVMLLLDPLLLQFQVLHPGRPSFVGSGECSSLNPLGDQRQSTFKFGNHRTVNLLLCLLIGDQLLQALDFREVAQQLLLQQG